MSEDDHRRAVLHRSQIVLQPLQLLVAKVAETSRFQIHYIHESDEVCAVLVEAVPSSTFRVPGIPFAEHRTIVVQHVVLARNEEHFLIGALEDLLDCVKLIRRGKMRDVPGMKNEVGGIGKCIDLIHGGFQSSNYVGIRGLVESHVAVADLYEREAVAMLLGGAHLRSQSAGLEDACFSNVQSSRAGPSHAFQEAAAIDAVTVMVVFNNP